MRDRDRDPAARHGRHPGRPLSALHARDRAVGPAALRDGCRGAHDRAGRDGDDRHGEPRGHPRRPGQGPARLLRRARCGCGIRSRGRRRDRRGAVARPRVRRTARRHRADLRRGCRARRPAEDHGGAARAARAVRRDLQPARQGCARRRAAPRRGDTSACSPPSRSGRPGSSACCRVREGGERVVEFPLAPFLGTMGVAVASDERPHSVPPGAHGGNIDIKLLTEGSVLYLPVQVDGALAYVGDPHFAQGDGEVALTALEASLRATLRFEVVPRAEALAEFGEVAGPLVRTPEYLVPTGLDPDLNVAMRNCVRAAIDADLGALGHGRAPRLRLPQRRDGLRHLAGGRHRVRHPRPHPRVRTSRGSTVAESADDRGDPGARTDPRRPLHGVRGLRARHPRQRPRRARRGVRRPDRARCAATRAGLLVGHDAISAFRGARGGVPARTIERVEYRPLGPDAALLVSVSRYLGGGTGLQTQVWERIDGRWLITAAHVTPRAQALDRSVWRTVGDPLYQGAWEGPLVGLNVAVKDLFAIKGYRIGAGNPTFLDEARAETTTAPAVGDLLRGGASLRGIARTDEFAYSIAGDNVHYGTPPNGAVPGALPGGSSSGPASAVATGQAEVGLATDTAGSVRVPASYQGLWGLRTTHGLVPRQGLLPLAQSFDTVGWLTRDGATLQRVVDWCLSYDGSESTESVYGESGADLPWRFLVPEEVLAAVEPDTRAAFDTLLVRLAASDDPPALRARLDRKPRRLLRAFPHRAGRRGMAQQRRLGSRSSGCRRPRRGRALPARSRRHSGGRGIRSPCPRAVARAAAAVRRRRGAAHADRAGTGADAHPRRRARRRGAPGDAADDDTRRRRRAAGDLGAAADRAVAARPRAGRRVPGVARGHRHRARPARSPARPHGGGPDDPEDRCDLADAEPTRWSEPTRSERTIAWVRTDRVGSAARARGCRTPPDGTAREEAPDGDDPRSDRPAAAAAHGAGSDLGLPERAARHVGAARRAVRPVHDRDDDRDAGALPRRVGDRERRDAARGRHLARRHRGGDGLAHPPRRPRARARLRPLRASARRDRRARDGRGAHDRDGVGAGLPAVGHRRGDRASQAHAPRPGPGRHLHDDEPAPRRDRRDLREARRAVLLRRHRVARRQRLRGGRVGAGCRDRRPAEVPRRPIRVIAHHAVGARGRRHRVPQEDRGRHPRTGRPDGIRLRPLELLRPRHDPRLLGSAAPQPPHRGDLDALRRPRVRAHHPARRTGCRHRPPPASPAPPCSPASRRWASRCSATSRTR